MTEEKKEEIKLTPAEDNPWYQFYLKSVELDKGDEGKGPHGIKPYGWHWFWGIYFLHQEMPKFPRFNLTAIQERLPDEHWLKNATDDGEKITYQSDGSIPDSACQDEAVVALYKILQNHKLTEPPKEIDFSKLIFSEHVDFSNLIFPMEVSFDDTNFSKSANFTQAKFFTHTRFANTLFGNSLFNGKARQADFQKAEFFDTVLFGNTIFKTKSNFQEVKFFNGGDFHGATFFSEVKFDDAEFQGFTANFQNAKFINIFNVFFRKTLFNSGARFYSAIFDCVNLDFDDAIFPKSVFFDGAEFSGHVNFRHIKMTAYMSFTNATFKKNIPSFYGAELYPNIVWNKVNWPFFVRPIDTKGLEEYKKTIQQNQIAYENISYHMEKMQKYHDQHFFFRQEMRCRRELEKNPFILFSYWLYEKIANYGYGIERAAIAWLLHIFIGFLVITFIAMCGGIRYHESLSCAISVSFTNANPYALFSFDSVKLAECYDMFNVHAPILFAIIKVIQTILGVGLLFLVLLTLRVRFRLK